MNWEGLAVAHGRMCSQCVVSTFIVNPSIPPLADKYQFQWWAVSLVDAVPYAGKKKGADTGIDGLIYFKPDGKITEKAIVSVKGGGNVSVTMIRDLGHVVEK
jgi:hypothetical protein